MRVLKGNPKSTAELIPADTVVNTLLAVAWYQHARKSQSDVESSLIVYNLTSNASRRLTWQSLGTSIQEIIDSTGAETFAKEPKLAKSLRELKLTPVWYHKKVHWLFRNPQFVAFWMLCCRTIC